MERFCYWHDAVIDSPRVGARFLKFGGEKYILGVKIFVFILCLKQISLGITQIGGHKNIWGALPPNAPTPWLLAWTRHQCIVHYESSRVVHGAKQSEMDAADHL